MALRKVKKNDLVAQIVKDNKLPCAFCKKIVDDELNYGKLYAIGDIQCHYFCALLSCCLVQTGEDNGGLFGFLYPDIIAEVARARKHKCSYCHKNGANMGCCVTQCRKQFHLPCGREKNSVSLFYGSYKSYCQLHAPKQKIPENIMVKARLRKKYANKGCPKTVVEDNSFDLEAVCVICYEEVPGYPTTETFWPPCCAKDAWFHRTCLQRMSLSAGMHYLKCPLCNNKEQFYEAVVGQGYYVPDRDAAWELEQNAFAEIYERPATCGTADCQCPMGRSHDGDNGPWVIRLCILCGSCGIHAQCQSASEAASESGRYVCAVCQPAAPADLDTLAESIESVILTEQRQNARNTRTRPVMPSRMSLRRTKGRALLNQSTSSQYSNVSQIKDTTPSTAQSREELNLKPPKRLSSPQKSKISSSPYTSPIKLLEESINQKSRLLDVKKVLDESVVEKLKRKLEKPRPLSAKRRIVNNILDGIFNESEKTKEREPIKDWCSPKKIDIADIKEDLAVQDDTNGVNKDNEINANTCNGLNRDIQNENNLNTVINDEQESRDECNEDKEDVFNNVKEKMHTTDLDNENAATKSFILSQNINTVRNVEKNTKLKDETDVSEFENSRNTNNVLEEASHLEELNKEDHSIKNNTKFNSEVNLGGDEEKCTEDLLDDNKLIKEVNDNENEEMSIVKDINADNEKEDNISKADLEIFRTPKTLKTINIDIDSSVEISIDNQSTQIDVVKIENSGVDNFKLPAIKSPVKNKKCFIKFSVKNQEVLQDTNFNLDLESFKNHYLSEVDGERSRNKSLDIKNDIDEKHTRKRKLETAGSNKSRSKRRFKKRKIVNSTPNIKIEDSTENNETCIPIPIPQIKNDNRYKVKNSLHSKEVINEVVESKKKRRPIKNNIRRKIIKSKKQSSRDTKLKLRLKNRNNVQLAIDTKEGGKRNKKTKLSVKIKWREERFNLKITESKRKKKIEKLGKCFKQYVLKYNISDSKVIAKPEGDISPLKRKYVKQEKPQDKLVQTSIESFFKKVP